MIELNTKKKLIPIDELDETSLELGANPKFLDPVNSSLIRNYDSLMDLKIKEKIKSMDNLLRIH